MVPGGRRWDCWRFNREEKKKKEELLTFNFQGKISFFLFSYLYLKGISVLLGKVMNFQSPKIIFVQI